MNPPPSMRLAPARPCMGLALGWSAGASKLLGIALLGLLCSRALLANAESMQFTYTGSAQVATSSYLPSERSNSLYFLNGLALSSGRWRLSASLPLVAQSNSRLLQVGGGAVPSGNNEIHSSDLGFGDPLVRVELEMVKARRRLPALRLIGGMKAPLAGSRDQGFGTGEWDYGMGMSLARTAGRGFFFADVAYWVLGDPPDLDVENALAYGVSYGRPLRASKLAILGSFIGYSRLVAGIAAPAQAGVMLSYGLRPGRSLSAGLSFGVTDSAPDASLSFGWRAAL